jgi:hypothetical protein
MAELTFDQLQRFAAKLRQNGLPPGTPVQVMHSGVPYEPCAICSTGKDYTVLHPVGIPHEECV